MKTRLWIIIVLLVCAFLAGCGDVGNLVVNDVLGFGPEYPTPELSEDLPPTYVSGFEQGYQSATYPSRFAKDLEAYSGQPHYHEGWDDGYAAGQAAVQKELVRQQRAAADAEFLGAMRH